MARKPINKPAPAGELLPTLGHNAPPVTIPAEDDVLTDLVARYPEVQTIYDDIERSVGRAPKRIADGDDDTAGKLQELRKKIAEAEKSWEQARGKEKRPWDGIAKCVHAFFAKKQDQLGKWQADLKRVHEDFLTRKASAARLEAERTARLQREEADRLAREAVEAEERAAAAERARLEAEDRAARARLEAEEQERLRNEAAVRAKAAEEAERKAAQERREREEKVRAQCVTLTTNLLTLLTEAENLDKIAATAEPHVHRRLNTLLESGGPLVTAGTALSEHETSLSSDQKAILDRARVNLRTMRINRDARDAATRAAMAEQERAARIADELAQALKFITVTMDGVERQAAELHDEPWTVRKDLDRLIDEDGMLSGKIRSVLESGNADDDMHEQLVTFDQRLTTLRAEREEKRTAKLRADQEEELVLRERAAQARAEQEEAERARKAAQADARRAEAEQAKAAEAITRAEEEGESAVALATKAESRASRMEGHLEGATDAGFSRTRSDRGTVGSLAQRWVITEINPDTVDLEALRGYLHPDAIQAAAQRFLMAHHKEWQGENNRVALKGVVYERIREARIA